MGRPGTTGGGFHCHGLGRDGQWSHLFGRWREERDEWRVVGGHLERDRQRRNRSHRCGLTVEGHVVVLIVRGGLHFRPWVRLLAVFFRDRWLLIDFLSIGWLFADFLIPLWLVIGNSVRVIRRI